MVDTLVALISDVEITLYCKAIKKIGAGGAPTSSEEFRKIFLFGAGPMPAKSIEMGSLRLRSRAIVFANSV